MKSHEIILLNFCKILIAVPWLCKLLCPWVPFGSSVLPLATVLDRSVLNLTHLGDLGPRPLPGIGLIHGVIHGLPLALEVTRVRSQSCLLLDLRKATVCFSLAASSELYALVLGEQENSFQAHRLALEPSVGDVVVARGILHHVVNTALTLIRVEHLLDSSSG